jgi:hypothetical protein
VAPLIVNPLERAKVLLQTSQKHHLKGTKNMSLYLVFVLLANERLFALDMTGPISVGITDPCKIWILLNLFRILNSDPETGRQK